MNHEQVELGRFFEVSGKHAGFGETAGLRPRSPSPCDHRSQSFLQRRPLPGRRMRHDNGLSVRKRLQDARISHPLMPALNNMTVRQGERQGKGPRRALREEIEKLPRPKRSAPRPVPGLLKRGPRLPAEEIRRDCKGYEVPSHSNRCSGRGKAAWNPLPGNRVSHSGQSVHPMHLTAVRATQEVC